MGHRTVIISSIANIVAAPEVRAEMTIAQCACVDQILQSVEPSVRDFRELTHVLNRVYAKPDED